MRDPCFGAVWSRDDWLEREPNNFVQKVTYTVMDPREVYLFHYSNYTVLSPEQFTNECGITTYEHSWSSELLPADMDIWQVIEDPTGKYNNEDGLQPFAFEL